MKALICVGTILGFVALVVGCVFGGVALTAIVSQPIAFGIAFVTFIGVMMIISVFYQI